MFFFFILVGKTAWEQLIGLYPYLVDCTTTSSAEVSRSLREALLQYCDLLQPPLSAINTGTGTSAGAGGTATSSTTGINGLSSHC